MVVANKKRSVTKEESSRSQLDTAIKLFFENRDLISAYTLAGAANGILEGVYKNERTKILARQISGQEGSKKIRFSWNEEWEIRLKPEYRKEGFRLLNATQNYFKHADRDHDSTREYDEWEETAARIFMTITNYDLVFGEVSPAMRVFFWIYMMLHPEFATERSPLRKLTAEHPEFAHFSSQLTQAEVGEMGYSLLERASPELFIPRMS